MPATLDNAFLFILQGTVLADLRYGGRINGSFFSQLISVCYSERLIKIGQYLPKLC